MSAPVSYERQGSVAVITVDNPPVNALSVDVRKGLLESVIRGASDAAVTAMVILGGGRTFIAGADIREFGKPPAPPGLHEVLDAIEASPKPVVAAIHGTALGGGLEVTLACHYRVAVPSAQVGLPEVKLGLLPGAGGTQRLPRIIGAEAALKMIVSGDPVRADRALALGIVDEIVADLRAGGVAFAEKVVAERRPLKKVSASDEKLAPARSNPAPFDEFRRSIAHQARGFLAPYKCIEAVQAAVRLPFTEGLTRERELFRECLESPQSRAQIHAFFAEREATKIPDVPRETAVTAIKTAAVIGAGTMGGGIAMNFANAGIPVTVVETAQEALDRGLAVVRKNYAATVEKGRLSQADMDRRLGLITGTLDLGAVREADIVIEAVFEEMAVKKEVFARLDAVARPGAVLATNTSTLDVDEIASATTRPGAVIGTHFFSPANVMRLLELVRGAKTARETIATAAELARRIGKVWVLAGNCDGFIGNRMLHGYLREAEFLLEEGATPQQVDRVIYDFGLPMGPFAMGDLAGLDVGWRIRKGKAHLRRKDLRHSPVADRLCEQGRFGQKTGAGWYRYEKGNRTPVPDPEVEKVIEQSAREQGITRRSIGDDEILKRCLYPLINEGARILEEGIALRASDIDVTYIYGYGFPRYRGGPMFWADTLGLKSVCDDVVAFHTAHGEPWTPAPLLVRLATEGKGFRDYARP
ncbi:MAG: enoyl-CoA hydratase/isomerase family protein [Candidatus Rokubacteria bacterium]|nr:enoyl-CoA hydratase/isomerase family protein [Candidatus Rokubacteria bacterium]MBI3827661.1 enoyl-CoA hydratase/isomerase family protein [Candidatus Rokubacteria bacterium]